MIGIMLDVTALVSIGLLGMGAIFRHNDRHILKFGGYVAFGLFWALRAPAFSHDAVNFLFAVLALPFFLFAGLEEYRVYRGEDGKPGMEMLAGGIFVGFTVYFLMARVPMMSGAIIGPVTRHSTMLLNALGGEYAAGGVIYPGSMWYSSGFMSGEEVMAPIIDRDGWTVVNIVLACTGVQSMMVFAGPILFTTRATRRDRASAIMIILPTIYILNLIRNAGIVIMMENGVSFHMAHDVIGKAGSLGAMFLLALLAFKLVPGLLDDVEDIIGLFIRRKPHSRPA